MTAGLGPGGFTEQHVRDYFRHLADLLAFTIVIRRSGVGDPALRKEWVHDPETRQRFIEALDSGKGVLMVGPHLTGMEIMVATAARERPLAVLARKSPDAEYEAIKQRWYDRLGVEVIHRPSKESKFAGLSEMTAVVRALKGGRILALTPDLVQKPGTGVPVRFLGRTVELPAGPFFLAVRTGAPLMPSFFHREDGHYRLWSHPPIAVEEGPDREATIAAVAQRWTDHFDAFVREHPDMWHFWLDKRWERWLLEPEALSVER
jgi:KDO2-lipid IV(A) lauroyltransferase